MPSGASSIRLLTMQFALWILSAMELFFFFLFLGKTMIGAHLDPYLWEVGNKASSPSELFNNDAPKRLTLHQYGEDNLIPPTCICTQYTNLHGI